jgi:hypothetical protein
MFAALGQDGLPPRAKDTLTVTHQGTGQALAHAAISGGRSAEGALQRGLPDQAEDGHPGRAGNACPGSYTRGDVLRITLEVNASADMTWVVITDPCPAAPPFWAAAWAATADRHAGRKARRLPAGCV